MSLPEVLLVEQMTNLDHDFGWRHFLALSSRREVFLKTAKNAKVKNNFCFATSDHDEVMIL
jgi:hypothetical protein